MTELTAVGERHAGLRTYSLRIVDLVIFAELVAMLADKAPAAFADAGQRTDALRQAAEDYVRGLAPWLRRDDMTPEQLLKMHMLLADDAFAALQCDTDDYLEVVRQWRARDKDSARVKRECADELAQSGSRTQAEKDASAHPKYTALKDEIARLADLKDEREAALAQSRIACEIERELLAAQRALFSASVTAEQRRHDAAALDVLRTSGALSFQNTAPQGETR